MTNLFTQRIFEAYREELCLRLTLEEEKLVHVRISSLLNQAIDLLEEADDLDDRLDADDQDSTLDSQDGQEWFLAIGYARLIEPHKRVQLRKRLERMCAFYVGPTGQERRPKWNFLSSLLDVSVEEFKKGFLDKWCEEWLQEN